MTRINLDQARRSAKELLTAARAGDAAALSRLPRAHVPPILADAQLAVARELGYPSWPKLVASVGWRPCGYEDVEWPRVQRLTLIPFIDELDVVVIPDDGLPSDELRPGEDAVLEAALRIPLEQAGFRRQGTHVVATAEDGTHVAAWIDGHRYSGRRPHRRDSEWWTGDPAEVDDPLVRLAAEARRGLTREQHIADMLRIIEPSYLYAETPQGGSGFNGPLDEWTANHQHIVEAIEADGTFLDVGCANGFLMECIAEWCAARGVHVEPYGVDISPALSSLARTRLPAWADRIWVGDAATWRPPRTFDTVHALLDTTETRGLRKAWVEHILTFVAPGGRLVLSHYAPSISARDVVEGLGFTIEGGTGLGVWLRRS